MSQECIEYKMHRNDQGRFTTPAWMSDGGYYQNPVDNTLIGFVPIEAEREWFVPDSVSTLTEQEFVTRCLAMHSSTPFQKTDGIGIKLMTDAEADAMLRQFYQSKVAE